MIKKWFLVKPGDPRTRRFLYKVARDEEMLTKLKRMVAQRNALGPYTKEQAVQRATSGWPFPWEKEIKIDC